jgi:translation initiation factor 1
MMTEVGDRGNARVVYSTGTGRLCVGCGRAPGDCRCRSRTSEAPLPARIVAKLRVEKKGRGGKVVSVVYGLPLNTLFLQTLCQELKRACGTGGAVAAAGDGAIELQGDLRERLRELLKDKGFTVKG